MMHSVEKTHQHQPAMPTCSRIIPKRSKLEPLQLGNRENLAEEIIQEQQDEQTNESFHFTCGSPKQKRRSEQKRRRRKLVEDV